MPPQRMSARTGDPDALNNTPLHGSAVSLARLTDVYLERGFSLIPLRADGKEPLAGTRGVNDTYPLNEAASWLAEGLNVGIKTGEPSDGLVVVDIDFGPGRNSNGEAMPNELLDFVSGLGTPVVLTPRGGVHVYCRSDMRRDSTTLNLDGYRLEISGDGRYVVAPPSTVQGEQYEFLVSLDDSLIDVEDFCSSFASGLGGVRRREQRGSLEVRGIPLVYKPSEPLSKLALYDGDPDFVQDVCKLLGIKLKGKFSCILPGHGPDAHPSANLWRDERGVYVYRDHHHAAFERKSYSLTEVYASVRSGTTRTLTRKAEHAVWKMRLLHELGRVELPEVVKPGLPSDAPSVVRKFLDGFCLLLQVQWAYRGVGQPQPFTEGFACSWCGISPASYWTARKYLMQHKFLRDAGRGARGMRFFQLSTYTPITPEEIRQ